MQTKGIDPAGINWLANIGRIFYAVSVAETGLQTIYYHDFPYWLIPPKHSAVPGLAALAYVFGTILLLAGISILFKIKARQISLLSGGLLLLIFCFCFIPYEFIAGKNYLSLLEWENAEKELAFASGAFVIAGCFPGKDEHPLIRPLSKLIKLGPILFAIPIISFGMLHVMYANGVSTYVPTWVPQPVFWTYLAGIGLLGSGISIILKIKTRLFAALLGSMISSWFIMLHIPRVVVSPVVYLGSEVTSAILALAYSGIAFAIAGSAKRNKSSN